MSLFSNRRQFLSTMGTAALSTRLNAQGTPSSLPAPAQAEPFALTQVRLLDGPFRDSLELNRRYLRSLPPDRLLHVFRVNAGLPSSAEPLGGWEKPDCEVRGHFVGHYLSACALMYAGADDLELKSRAVYVVDELAKCQQALGHGYLSAFPVSFFDRLNAREKVWAPFYTIHKIMAGLLDVYALCGYSRALEVVQGMADWVDRWSAPLTYAHMQDVLNTEFGGMAEVMLNLQAATGTRVYGTTAARFEKVRFLDPLAAGRDELKGLHVNTHVPQVIGAARRFELTQDPRYSRIASYFWGEVTNARTYCTGGTSNAEIWMNEPYELAEELPKSTNTEECCVAYNMLKLTRHLYKWSADPRLFDYYERVLFNHRLGTLDPESGSGMYYLPLHANSWKVFGSKLDSFWCCTGTGVEEHAKLADSIYFHDSEGVFVNLFIPSELNWTARGIQVRQETKFPDQSGTKLTITTAHPARFTVRVRVPSWSGEGGSARLNGMSLETFAAAGGYFVVNRTWKNNDTLEIDLPMTLRAEPISGDPHLVAFLKGPIVLAAQMGSEGLTPAKSVNGSEPQIAQQADQFERLQCDPKNPTLALNPVTGSSLHYLAGNLTFAPLSRIFGQRYSVYWRTA